MADDTTFPVSKLPRLKKAESIDDVIANFDTIIDWSIDAKSEIGYFPTVYKRATVAIKEKIKQGNYFDDDARMLEFDKIFANRYFDALNLYFHPADYQAPTHTWQWCFDGHEYARPDAPIILQHMLTAVNSHVNLDLGIAAVEAAGGDPIKDLQGDFNKINELLAGEVTIFLDTLAQLSERVKVIRRTLCGEDQLLNAVLRIFRNMAWAFSLQLAANPKRRRASVSVQDSWSAVLGSYYLHPDEAVDRLVVWIREKESQDVAYNLRVLDGRQQPS